MKRIFISYSHDSDTHKERVHAFAKRLANSGLSIALDRDELPGGPPEGWPQWSQTHVLTCEKVLVVCSDLYCRAYENVEELGSNHGARYEARAIRQILNESSGWNKKFRVITLTEADDSYIPLDLRGYHRYKLFNDGDYDQLVTWLVDRSSDTILSQNLHGGIAWATKPLGYEWNLADRQDFFLAFENVITGVSTRRVLLLTGSTNSGKTAVIAELKAHANHLRLPCALVDLKGCASLDDLFQSLRSDLGSNVLESSYRSTGSTRFHDLFSDFRRLVRPLVLLFDTYEDASNEARMWIERQLLLRIDAAPALIVVVAGQEIPDRTKFPWRELAEIVKLSDIEGPAAWLEYVERKPTHRAINRGDVELLAIASKGNPGVMSALLDAIAEHLQTPTSIEC